eukprot:3662131-Pyramimonas_sp.AAC.1
MASAMLQEAPRPPQDGPKWPTSLRRKPPGSPESCKTICNSKILAISTLGFRRPSEASRWPQEGPRWLQEEPKMAPRWPQERPRAPRRPRETILGAPEGR